MKDEGIAESEQKDINKWLEDDVKRWITSKLPQELNELASDGMMIENQSAVLTALEVCVLSESRSLMEGKGRVEERRESVQSAVPLIHV